MSIDKDLLDRLMEGRSPGDLFGKSGILSELTKALAERALSTEMDVHLDEERTGEAPEGQNRLPNRRNGRRQKMVTTDSGKVVLDIPCDGHRHPRPAFAGVGIACGGDHRQAAPLAGNSCRHPAAPAPARGRSRSPGGQEGPRPPAGWAVSSCRCNGF